MIHDGIKHEINKNWSIGNYILQPKTGLQRVRWCLMIPVVIPVYFKHGLPSLVGMMCKCKYTWGTQNHWELEYFKQLKAMCAKSDVLVSCLSSLTFP